MSRIPYPDESKLSEKKKAAVAKAGAKFLNISRIALHAPDNLWEAHYTLKKSVIADTELDPNLKEVLIIVTGGLSKCEYEIYHHRSIAGAMGFPPEKIAALEQCDFTNLTPIERAVAQFTKELVLDVSPSDAALADLRSFLPDRTVLEMIIVITSYMATARMVEATGVGNDEHAVVSWENDPALVKS